jgi:hypothetical protein
VDQPVDSPLEAAVYGLASTQGGCVSAGQLAELGWTRARSGHRRRSNQWRSVLPGVYLVSAQAQEVDWHELDLVTRAWAATLMHGPGAILCGTTAALIHGIEGLERDTGTVHVLLPPGNERHQVPGVRVHTQLLDPDKIQFVDGFLVTNPQRTVLDLVLSSRREVAVSLLDSALNKQLLCMSDLADMRIDGRGRRGAARAASWWDLADARAQSPLETRARLITSDAGMPPDELQYPVHDRAGVLLGYGDLAWKRRGRRTLILETDGRDVHGQPFALYRDRYRSNDFTSAGTVDLLRATWRDVVRPAYLLSLLRRNLA